MTAGMMLLTAGIGFMVVGVLLILISMITDVSGRRKLDDYLKEQYDK